MRAILAALLLASAVLAGCATSNTTTTSSTTNPPGAVGVPGVLYEGTGGLFAGPALYSDPQNAPHPSFNFPTLAHPAVGDNVPALWKPAPSVALPSSITAIEHVAQTEGVAAGAGIALFGSLAVVPTNGRLSQVVDIRDPTNPQVLSEFQPQENMTGHRGAAFIPYPDGRLAVVISTGAGIDVWDLTDPVNPKPLPPLFIENAAGQTVVSHKVGVIPGTPIIVNAASDGGGAEGASASTATGVSQMFDLSDPENPVRLPDFQNGYSCHHVYFWNNVDLGKYRGVCAGIQYTQVWDTTDPYNPSVIVSVPFGSGGTPLEVLDRSTQIPSSISHYAGLSLDGTILMMGDESGGGSSPPGCTARVEVPMVGAVSVPIGAVWFYDVTVETAPVYLGHYSASQLDKFAGGLPDDPATAASRSCTAHHGRIIPVEGRDVLAMSWYASGVIVVDFTNVRAENGGLPMTIAQYVDDSDTWETWYYNGYLYTGDLARGMDILKFA